MNFRYGLLLPAMLVVLLFVGSASAKLSLCPDIPPPPYNPKSPQEDIVKVEAFLTPPSVPAPLSSGTRAGVVGYFLTVRVTFAAATPPTGQVINIIVTELQGNPPTEVAILCGGGHGLAMTTYELSGFSSTSTPNIAVYAWLGPVPGTDRAPNTGSYPITSLSAAAPNDFYDPEGAVGGVVMPTNTLAVLAPYIALAGLIVAVSAVVVVKKRRD